MSGSARSSGVRLAEVVVALSRGTDLAMGQPLEFAVHSCFLAVRLGEELGYDESTLRDIYYQSLLRYIGCNADTQGLAAIVGDELTMRSDFAEIDTADKAAVLKLVLRHIRQANAATSPLHIAREIVRGLTTMPRFVEEFYEGHCEVAQRLAERLGFDKNVVVALGQLYERWDGKGLPKGLKGEAVAPAVRVVTLAQDAVIHHRLGGTDAAVAIIKERSGGAYEPRIVESFCAHAETLCSELAKEPSLSAVLDLEPGTRPKLNEVELDEACRAIADFGDLKSTYMLGHSHGVAQIASGAAQRLGLPEDAVKTLQRAGCLHDVGRVAVSAGIWTRPGPLSDREWEQVRLHPYHTERIFSKSASLSRIASLASHDDERLDGSGYHRGVGGSALSPAMRVMAAADVYQSMTEDRPHRAAHSLDAAAAQLRTEVRSGRLDTDAVEAVLGVAGHRSHAGRREFVSGLTDREVEILQLLARGESKKQVASSLHVSPKTIDNHVQHIYEKIGVTTRAGAALFAVEHSLLA